ncbi:MAG: hypothetical protein Q9159_003712 [Coniocarpon cinnabarinum]
MYYTRLTTALSLLAFSTSVHAQCPDYSDYSQQYHAPFSTGRYNLSSQRPDPACRTFNSSVVEDTVTRLQGAITDPDLRQLFTNAYPNTLDTAIRWKGYAANNSEEELTFVITGDINAMWLRDSANQMQSYLPVLSASNDPNSLASLYRGVINLQSRYLLSFPYCQSFQPPVEANIPPAQNGAANMDMVVPPYDNATVFECKYELDSLAAFLEVSSDYYRGTGDGQFFAQFQWQDAVQAVLNVANSMMQPTYTANGTVNMSPYTFERTTTSATETLDNSGAGNPVARGSGLVRSAFRPSDDSCIYQLFVPANAMFSVYLDAGAEIMGAIGNSDLQAQMTSMSASIKDALGKVGIGHDPTTDTDVYAFEVDGYGSQNLMDDANIPSLLSLPFLNFTDSSDATYQATRAKVLSNGNPYYASGPALSSIGGPHNGPGYVWPMAKIVQALTSDNDTEISSVLQALVSSTDGYGLIHESVNNYNVSDWTRQWCKF